jgi:3'-phosphoadenosine 5'-phosphosulfate sulfotransferase (PAPS reductase)/FAD synthetase
MKATVFSYGGGRQTVAMCVLIARGVLPKPDRIVIADTSRENPSTWEYLEQHVQPMLNEHGLTVEVASHELATVDLHGKNGDLLLPVFTQTGKLQTYCSNEWKRRVVDRHLRKAGITGGIRWIGFAFDEKRRWNKKDNHGKPFHGRQSGKWLQICPLVDLMVNTAACAKIVRDAGLPPAPHSSCWMCPHKRNAEWRDIRDNYPDQWREAIQLDEELRNEDERGGVFLHHSRQPLNIANIDDDESKPVVQQCTLGSCFV